MFAGRLYSKSLNKFILYVALCFVTYVVICLVLSLQVNAHPGNTDSSGGHTCRTNCPAWGLEYGEYHYHNSGGSYADESPDYQDQGLTNGQDAATDDSTAIETEATRLGDEKGREDKLDGNYSPTLSQEPTFCSREFNFTGYSPDEYRDAFYEAYHENCKEIYENAYSTSYESGYTEAKSNLELEEENKLASESDAINWIVTAFWSGIIIVCLWIFGKYL